MPMDRRGSPKWPMPCRCTTPLVCKSQALSRKVLPLLRSAVDAPSIRLPWPHSAADGTHVKRSSASPLSGLSWSLAVAPPCATLGLINCSILAAEAPKSTLQLGGSRMGNSILRLIRHEWWIGIKRNYASRTPLDLPILSVCSSSPLYAHECIAITYLSIHSRIALTIRPWWYIGSCISHTWS